MKKVDNKLVTCPSCGKTRGMEPGEVAYFKLCVECATLIEYYRRKAEKDLTPVEDNDTLSGWSRR